jgi:hypothetical protein
MSSIDLEALAALVGAMDQANIAMSILDLSALLTELDERGWQITRKPEAAVRHWPNVPIHYTAPAT